MKKVLMIVFNSFEHDARVERAARTLAQGGYAVTVLCDAVAHLPAHEVRDAYQVVRLDHLALSDSTNQAEASTRAASGIFGRLASQIKHGLQSVWHTLLELRHTSHAVRFLLTPLAAVMARRAFAIRYDEYMRRAESATTYARSCSPDIVHAHDFKGLLAAARIHELLSVPYAYDSHELWTERNRTGALIAASEREWELATEKGAVLKASLCIVVCESIAEHLTQRYGIPRPLVIRNIPDPAPLPTDAKGLKSRLGLAASDFLLVYAGRATSGRGLMDIAKALALTPQHVKLLVVGYFDPGFEPQFKAAVDQLHLRGRVIEFGAVPPASVVATIGACDLSLVTINAVCLSYYFALPNKLLESIQAGVPVVGTRLPEIAGLIDRFHCGRTFEDGDFHALAEIISDMAAAPDQLTKYRKASQAAAGELNVEREQAKLLDGYRNSF